MSPKTSDILREAMLLPESERGELAAELLASLDAGADADAQAAWEAEIRQRVDDLDAGRAEPVPWEEAIRAIEGAHEPPAD